MTLTLADNPNLLGDREAMGLPDTFVARTPAALLAGHEHLLGVGARRLAEIAENPLLPFARRHAAGALLGLLGDPRIRPLAPSMCEIPVARARIGLDPRDVERVVAEWARVGVIEPWIAKECPVHTVELARYALMRYPVTNLEYRLFLEDTRSTALPTSWTFGIYPAERSNHPVWSVAVEAAEHYARWLSAKTGRAFRLPTEAEWEHAAAGNDACEYPWGERFDPAAANTVESGPLSTTPIGLFPAGRSAFGIDDLGGNVEEYVADDYRAYPGGTTIDDDLALTQGTYRVARGGSFTRFGDLTRCARRHGRYQRDIYAMGFRLAETLR